MFARVTAKNVGDFFETVYINLNSVSGRMSPLVFIFAEILT